MLTTDRNVVGHSQEGGGIGLILIWRPRTPTRTTVFQPKITLDFDALLQYNIVHG